MKGRPEIRDGEKKGKGKIGNVGRAALTTGLSEVGTGVKKDRRAKTDGTRTDAKRSSSPSAPPGERAG